MDASATPVFLSRFQKDVLWHLSQGYTIKETAAQMGTARQAVVDSLRITRRKLDAKTNYQLVLKGYLAGAYGPARDCGTRASYVRHGTRDEDPCPACRRGNAYWLQRQSEPPVEVRQLTDAQLKILRAFHVGRTHADLRRTWKISESKLSREVKDMYARLGVSDVPREERREAALQIGLEHGLLRPGAPRAQSPILSAPVHLTAREKEILRAVDEHTTLAAAAAALAIKPTSLGSRLTDIYYKLDVAYLPRKQKRPAALNEARRRGYAL